MLQVIFLYCTLTRKPLAPKDRICLKKMSAVPLTRKKTINFFEICKDGHKYIPGGRQIKGFFIVFGPPS